MGLYASGRRTGLFADVTKTGCSCIAAFEGFVVTESSCHKKFPEFGSAESTSTNCIDTVLQMVSDCVSKSPMDLRATFLANTFITGTGLKRCGVLDEDTRGQVALKMNGLFSERHAHLSEAVRTVLKVMVPKEYKYAAWIGASVLADLSLTTEAWINHRSTAEDGEVDTIASELCPNRAKPSANGADASTALSQGALPTEAVRHMYGGHSDGEQFYWASLNESVTGPVDKSIYAQYFHPLRDDLLKGPTSHLITACGKQRTVAELNQASAKREAVAEKARADVMKTAEGKTIEVYARPVRGFRDRPCKGGHVWLPCWGQTLLFAKAEVQEDLTSGSNPTQGGTNGDSAAIGTRLSLIQGVRAGMRQSLQTITGGGSNLKQQPSQMEFASLEGAIPGLIKQGWLMKRGAIRKTWKKRQFDLTFDGIRYYGKDRKKGEKGVSTSAISLSACRPTRTR